MSNLVTLNIGKYEVRLSSYGERCTAAILLDGSFVESVTFGENHPLCRINASDEEFANFAVNTLATGERFS